MNSNKLEGQKLGLFIFECVMAVLYLAFSFIFLFSSLFNTAFQGGVRIALGVVLGLYGTFRIYRAIKKIVRKGD